jgi:hypothetical protein
MMMGAGFSQEAEAVRKTTVLFQQSFVAGNVVFHFYSFNSLHAAGREN